jgi:serine/threonine-protein kinase
VRSEYVASVVDFLSDNDHGLMLVLQLIPGESLLSILQRQRKISLELALMVGQDIARGLKDLHDARIVHRDLKPGNVVLQPFEDGQFRAVLIDFGISRILSDPSEDKAEEVTAITRAGTVLGTLEYIAPEQIFGSQTVTATADLYALGAIIYKCVAGQHAFVANADAALLVLKMTGDAPELPLEGNSEAELRARQLVACLLAREPSMRLQSAAEVLEEIELILSMMGESELACPTGVRSAAAGVLTPEIVELEADPEPSVTGVELQPAMIEEEDSTAVTVDFEEEPPPPPPAHEQEEEIKTVFLPPRPMFTAERQPAVVVQPQAFAPPPPQPQPAAGAPAGVAGVGSHPGYPAQRAAMPMAPAPQGLPAYGTPGPRGGPRSQWSVETLPANRAQHFQAPPLPPPVRQSAVETVHIQAFRQRQNSGWLMLLVAIVAAALAGAVVTWLVLPRLLEGMIK